MKERVIETATICGTVEDIGFAWDGPSKEVGKAVAARSSGKRFRATVEIIETVPTPAEDWLEFSSRFGGDGKPPARMLKLVKTWEKPHRCYFGRWIELAGLRLDAGTKREAERTCLRVLVGRLFAGSEYEDWMLADKIIRDEEE